MQRRKFIIGPNWTRANQYVRDNNFRIKDFVIVFSPRALCGIDAKTIEFVLLNGYYYNEFHKEHGDMYRYFIELGAIETYVDF